jgi:hypothetical protein
MEPDELPDTEADFARGVQKAAENPGDNHRLAGWL